MPRLGEGRKGTELQKHFSINHHLQNELSNFGGKKINLKFTVSSSLSRHHPVLFPWRNPGSQGTIRRAGLVPAGRDVAVNV